MKYPFTHLTPLGVCRAAILLEAARAALGAFSRRRGMVPLYTPKRALGRLLAP